ncbi:MAG: hypothetical protein ABW068_09155, partial [Candidatus Thiodiazotropha sp.]
APTARRVSSIASRLPGTTSLRFAFPGWQRWSHWLLQCDQCPYPARQSKRRIHHPGRNCHCSSSKAHRRH